MADEKPAMPSTVKRIAEPARWEWRTFEKLRPIEALRDMDLSEGDSPTTETYVLSATSQHNVKLRNGRIDVKCLLQTSHDGLEQWSPVLNSEFPIRNDDLRIVCDSLRIPHGREPRADTTEHFVHDVAELRPLIHVLTIVKHRVRFTIAQCRGELVNVKVGLAAWDSVALEDENPERVRNARTILHLDRFENTNYPKALKRIRQWVDLMPA